MVTEGNRFWYNPDVPKVGRGLGLKERVESAVSILKAAGYTFDTEPVVVTDGEYGTYVETPGEGLRHPDGSLVEEMEIASPSEAYDPLRATFAVMIERALNDVGIPVRANLTTMDNVRDLVLSDTAAEDLDMWVLGWSLPLVPDYLGLYFHTLSFEDGFNFGSYSNPAFDELDDTFLNTADVTEARTIAMQMQEILAADLPYVVLFSPTITEAYRPSKVTFPYTSVLGGIQFSSGLQTVALID
jgi:ABC-type transport system substrate-binding protein